MGGLATRPPVRYTGPLAQTARMLTAGNCSGNYTYDVGFALVFVLVIFSAVAIAVAS